MSDELKSRNEGEHPQAEPKKTVVPLAASEIQGNPKTRAPESAKNKPRAKRSPLLRIARIIKKRLRGDRPKWTDRAIVVLTGGIVFFALMQHLDMKESGEQTNRLICAQQRIAAAMETSLGQSQIAFAKTTAQTEIAQRAWVSGGVFPRPPFGGGNYAARIVIENNGRTPALDVWMAKKAWVITKTQRRDLSLPAPTFTKRDFLATIQPNATPHLDVPFEIDQEAIKAEKVRYYIAGRIDYRDVFGAQHWSTFCLYLTPGGEWMFYSKFNEIDATKE